MECRNLQARSIEILHFILFHSVGPYLYPGISLIHLPLSGFSALRSHCFHSRSGILPRDAMHASEDVIIFVRQGLSFPELSTSSLSSFDPYSDYVGVNNSSSLSFLNFYASPIRTSPTDRRSDSFSPCILPFSRNLFILGDFNCHRPLLDSIGTSDPGRKELFDGIIFSDLLPLNVPDIPTHFSSILLWDLLCSILSLAFSCSWEVLQELGSNHLTIQLTIPLSPQQTPPSFNFQKVRWDDFTFYFDSRCPSAEEHSSLSLSSAAALFTSPTLNAAKSSIPFGLIKRHLQAWWSGEVKEAVSERRKAFAAAHRSDEDCKACISAS